MAKRKRTKKKHAIIYKIIHKSCISKDRQYNGQKKRDKKHAIIYKIIHKKLYIEGQTIQWPKEKGQKTCNNL